MHPAGLLFMPAIFEEQAEDIMMKKGVFGYLAGKRIFSILKSLLLLSAVLAIYFAALSHFGTNKNVFSILAAVGALPAGRSIVETIMLIRARGASQEVKDKVSCIEGLDAGRSGFDLYLTAYETAYSLSHAAAGNGRVVGYTEDASTDPVQCARYIRSMLSKDGLTGYEVSVYSDLGEYLKILKTGIFSSEAGAGSRQAFGVPENAGQEKDGTREQDKKVMQLLYAISL